MSNDSKKKSSPQSSVDEIEGFKPRVDSSLNLTTEIIHAEDDPTLSPWTFRIWFLCEPDIIYVYNQLLKMVNRPFSFIVRRIRDNNQHIQAAAGPH